MTIEIFVGIAVTLVIGGGFFVFKNKASNKATKGSTAIQHNGVGDITNNDK